jgi:hypothetical protein
MCSFAFRSYYALFTSAEFLPMPECEHRDIFWLSAAQGCDGETIAVTAARSPCIEELLPGVTTGEGSWAGPGTDDAGQPILAPRA